MRRSHRVDLTVGTDAAVAGSLVRRLALASGASTVAAAEIATAAAELASNAVRHGGGGALEVSIVDGAVELSVRNAEPRVALTLEARVAAARADRPNAGRGVGTVSRFMDHVDVSCEDGLLRVRARRALDRGVG